MKETTWTPGSLLQISGSYWQSATLHAAVKLDIFQLLGAKNLSASEVATSLEADTGACQLLLDALCAMELLKKSASTYGNSEFSSSYLDTGSPTNLCDIIMHHQNLYAAWGQLDLSVREGEPRREGASDGDEEQRKNFLMGMHNLASLTAPAIAAQIDLGGYEHLLDLGGGPGTFALHFCQKNPELQAIVYDLPTSRPFAEQVARQMGLQNSVSFQEGDFTRSEIEGSYDVAWLSHILHGEDEEACRMIIEKAVACLRPGGRILIHEFILNNEKDGPLFPALFSLNMLLNTPGGRSYSEAELFEMLRDTGVQKLEHLSLDIPGFSSVISGEV